MDMTKRYPTLIVDDSRDHAELVRSILAPLELESSIAQSGAEALDMLATRRFALLLTDLAMPGMDGLKLLKKVRERYEGLPVIVITSFGDVRSAVKAMQAGAFSYFTKGGDPDELQAEVKKALRSIETKTPPPPSPIPEIPSQEPTMSLKQVREKAEAEHIISVLSNVGGSRTKAAEMLGITYRQLYNRLKNLLR